jgi:UDP-glucose 4-epimerase
MGIAMPVHLITGGAGFVGVNLARRLLERNETVVAFDDLSLGRRESLNTFDNEKRFAFHLVDCADSKAFLETARAAHERQPITDVWHLAANSDIPAGVADPSVDKRRTFETTYETLVVMRALGIARLHFASSSAIYGDVSKRPIAEDHGPLEPISNYGAMKLASEAQIRAAVEAYLPRADIFRFPNVVGVPATHGVIVDLVRKSRATPAGFDVLGDGTQQKIYLHADDLVAAMLFIADNAPGRYNVFNIGPDDEGASVRAIAEAVRDRVSPGAAIRYGKGSKGWVGDVPGFRYATHRLAALGWTPSMGSVAAIRRAVEEIARQEGAK